MNVIYIYSVKYIDYIIFNLTICKSNHKYAILMLLLHVFVPIDHPQGGYLQSNIFVIKAVNDILGVKVRYQLKCL